jgi:hypothetical protein
MLYNFEIIKYISTFTIDNIGSANTISIFNIESKVKIKDLIYEFSHYKAFSRKASTP